MMVTFLYILINITHPELKGEAIACSMGLFIFYTWRRILLILITAAIAFALATMMSYVTENPIVVTLSFIMALIVAQSRIDTRVHTFWEVLAGALLGFAITILIFRVFGY